MKITNQWCCNSTRPAAIVLACFGVILGSGAVIIYATGFGIQDKVFAVLDKTEQETQSSYEAGDMKKEDYEYVLTLYTRLENSYSYILGFGLATGLLYIVTNVMLIFGVLHQKSWLMIPWLVATMVGLISHTSVIICYAVYNALKGDIINAFIYSLIYCPIFLISLYFWTVVNSVYWDVRKEKVNGFDLEIPESNHCNDTKETPTAKYDPPPPYTK